MIAKTRDYQKECIQIIEKVFKKRDRQLIQLPTGSGKTWIFSQYLERNSDRALIICPSKELKEQIIETAKQFNITSISGNLKENKKNHVITTQILAYESNLKTIHDRNYDHIIIDEAHHAQSKTYKNLLENVPYKFKLLGCTATPERLDKKNLLDIFDIISYQKTIYELISSGYLADVKSYRIKTGQNISKRGYDFRAIELKLLDNDSRNKLLLKTYMENCKDKKTLIFCLNINHSINISNCLNNNNIKSAYIHGRLPLNERKKIIKKFKFGEIQEN